MEGREGRKETSTQRSITEWEKLGTKKRYGRNRTAWLLDFAEWNRQRKRRRKRQTWTRTIDYRLRVQGQRVERRLEDVDVLLGDGDGLAEAVGHGLGHEEGALRPRLFAAAAAAAADAADAAAADAADAGQRRRVVAADRQRRRTARRQRQRRARHGRRQRAAEPRPGPVRWRPMRRSRFFIHSFHRRR